MDEHTAPPLRPFEPMSPLDAGFLAVETARAPLHAGALAIFEGDRLRDAAGRVRLTAARHRIESRLHLVPRLRMRLATVPLGLGLPVWVDDETFSIERHVRTVALPPPGDTRQLTELCTTFMMRPLDRRHPLWEVWLVDGLADGRVAMLEKIHHSMVDGVAGVATGAAFLDLEAEPAGGDDEAWPPDWTPRRPPSPMALLAHAAGEQLRLPADLAGAAARAARAPLGAFRRLAGTLDLVGSEAPDVAHRSPLRRPVGYERALAWTTLELEPIRRAGHQLGATVNDVVLAGLAGAMRAVLEARGEPVDRLRLQAAIPVDLRRATASDEPGNQVAVLIAPLPVDEDTAGARLGQVRDAVAGHRRHGEADASAMIFDSLRLLPSFAVATAGRVLEHQPVVDVIVTNVPGPPMPLWFLGARMEACIPIVPLVGNVGLGVAALSYGDHLTVSILADPATFPEVDALSRAVRREIESLEAWLT